MYLPLINDAFIPFMYEFDWILNRYNITSLMHIDVIDHGSLGCAFSASCRPGNQDQTAGETQKIFHNLRRIKLIQGRNLSGDNAKCGGYTIYLMKRINSKIRKRWIP